MRLVVTGATGFVGSALVRRALAAGHDVCAMIRSGAAPAAAARLTVCSGTLAAPPWDELTRFAADSCVHTAWITTAGVYPESPDNDRYRDESLAFLTGLLQRGVGHAVVLGTSAEYRPSSAPLHEDASPLEPATRYAHAKRALHVALLERTAAAGRLGWARIFQPYGAGEPVERLCSAVVSRLAAGERMTLDNPNAIRDWIHVDDVAAALLCLAESRTTTVVNVGTGVGRTVGSVALTIAGMLGRPDLISVAPPGPPAPGLVADVTRLRGLGWTPRVALDTGLAALVERHR